MNRLARKRIALTESRPGVVTVVLVNYMGADDTIAAVVGLHSLDWPSERLEVVVVDNASGDGSLERFRAELPGAIIVDAGENLGFAAGCNLGVANSSGEFVAFLNSDAKPDGGWIRAAVQAFQDETVTAVASKVLDADGLVVDFIDAGLTWFGKGYKPFVGETAGSLGSKPKDVLFGTGAAMFVRRDAYVQLGGFDDRYFMFYEDVDFGWRLNLRGWRFRYVPDSVAFHKHHGTVGKFGSFKETYLLERNALFTLYKNLEHDRLNEALPAALALTVRRGVAAGNLDSSSFDFRNAAKDSVDTEQVSRATLASVFAVDQFVEHLPYLVAARAEVQSSRRVTDRAVWSLSGRVDGISREDKTYAEGYDNIVDAFDVAQRPGVTKVLVITGDPIGAKMAGPAIRAWHIAEALAVEHEVTLVTLSTLEQVAANFTLRRLRAGDDRGFAPLEAWADIIIFQGHAMAAFEVLQHSSKVVVADIYDPMHLEQLEQGRELPAATWDKQVADATSILNEQLSVADFFLCASDRQRMFYLGQLAALGRINPANYHDDPDLTGLLAVVPFGFDSTPVVHERQVLKGVREGIGPDDKVLLWAGGLYNWFDPATLIRAVAEVAVDRPQVRLFFQGTKHPHPGVPEMAVVAESRALSRALGVLDSVVFFNDSWVNYADRQNYLAEADAGVSTHFSHVETTFSFRTRILDYLWAELPMVVTEGDSFAELVEHEGLGIVVPERDVKALAGALNRILFDVDFIAACRDNIARVRSRFEWGNTLAPLVAFVRDAHVAADRAEGRIARGGWTSPARGPRRKQYGLRHSVFLVAHHLRHGGPVVVVRKVLARVRRR
jgi:GT2 family glycosyltransferase/glycosyltransferase involved in cell wall biosynthesis